MEKSLTGIAWLMGGRIAYMGLSLISTAILARLLSPADFGVLAVVMLVVGLPTALFDGAFAIGLIQKKTIDDQLTSDAFWASLLLSVLFFLPIFLAAKAIEQFFQFEDLASLVRITACVIFFKAAANVPTALLQRHGKHKHIAALTVVSYLVGYCIVGIGMALMGYGAAALVAAVTVTATLEFVLSFAISRMRLRPPPSWVRLVAVFSSSSMLTLAQLFNWGANTGANIVIGRLLGATELGLYSRGWKLALEA